MMDYFQNTPAEVIISIAKDLDMKSLCNLIMSSKEFKSLCDTNEIWRYHYLKTIQSKWKITENSVHIGGAKSRKQKYLYEFSDDLGEKIMVTSYQTPNAEIIQSVDRMIWDNIENVKFIKELGCDPFITYFPSRRYHDEYSCNDCMTSQMKDIMTNEYFLYDCPSPSRLDEWKSDILSKWKTFNESRGLHKLCQDPTHYDMDTLEIPGSCRGFKNYKKVVVKKLLTPIKQNITSYKCYREKNWRMCDSSNPKIENKNLKENRHKYEEHTLSCIKEREQKLKRFQDAIDCM